MRLLGSRRFLGRCAKHEDQHKRKPASDGGADAREPGPGARDDVGARPLVVGHVADRDGVLGVDVGQEGALVVDLEVEDAVLVGRPEGDRVGRRLLGRRLQRRGLERQTVEGREHRELELELIVGGDGKGPPGLAVVLGERDGVGLRGRSAHDSRVKMKLPGYATTTTPGDLGRTTSLLTR